MRPLRSGGSPKAQQTAQSADTLLPAFDSQDQELHKGSEMKPPRWEGLPLAKLTSPRKHLGLAEMQMELIQSPFCHFF